MALRTLARRGLEETVVRARGGGATTTATTGTIAGAWLRFRSDDATTTTTTTTGEAGTREANATAEAKATIETLGSEGAPTEERKTRRRKPPTKETAATGKDGGATSAKKKRAGPPRTPSLSTLTLLPESPYVSADVRASVTAHRVGWLVAAATALLARLSVLTSVASRVSSVECRVGF